MSGNFAIKGGGVGRLMANAILNFHFDFLHTSLSIFLWKSQFPRDEIVITKDRWEKWANVFLIFSKTQAQPKSLYVIV